MGRDRKERRNEIVILVTYLQFKWNFWMLCEDLRAFANSLKSELPFLPNEFLSWSD